MSEDMSNSSFISNQEDDNSYEEMGFESRFFDINDVTYEDNSNRLQNKVDSIDSTKSIPDVLVADIKPKEKYHNSSKLNHYNIVNNPSLGSGNFNESYKSPSSNDLPVFSHINDKITQTKILNDKSNVMQDCSSNLYSSLSSLTLDSHFKSIKEISQTTTEDDVLKQPITMNTMVYLHLQNKKKNTDEIKRPKPIINNNNITIQYNPNNMLFMYQYQNYLNYISLIHGYNSYNMSNSEHQLYNSDNITCKKRKKVGKRKKETLVDNSSDINIGMPSEINIGKTTTKKKKKKPCRKDDSVNLK